MKASEAFEYLMQGFASGRLAQAYIIEGPVRGESSDLVGRVLQMLFCKAPESPCGGCVPCRQALERTHPDLQWVEPQKKSRIIAIDQVRDLQQRVFQTPFCGGWKAVVVAGADRLRDASANAFLKTLEEPPDKTLFLLMTENPQYLLPTILSRCQYLLVSGQNAEIPDAWREEVLDILVGAGQGVPGVTGGLARAARMSKLLKVLQSCAQDAVMTGSEDESADRDGQTLDARVNARYREMRSDLMRFVLLYYRDVFLGVCRAGGARLSGDDAADGIARKVAALNYRQALRNVRVIEDMERQFESNLPEASVLNLGFSRLS
jgi:DNA polymerase-3 subunit delta'